MSEEKERERVQACGCGCEYVCVCVCVLSQLMSNMSTSSMQIKGVWVGGGDSYVHSMYLIIYLYVHIFLCSYLYYKCMHYEIVMNLLCFGLWPNKLSESESESESISRYEDNTVCIMVIFSNII